MEFSYRMTPDLEAAPDFLKVTLAFFLPAARDALAERLILCVIISVAMQLLLVEPPKLKTSRAKNYKTQKSDLKINHSLALLG